MMFYNYLKVAFRNYRKNSLYASLNIIGLSIAYIAVVFVAIYLHYETSFESFHSKSDRIYRPTHHYNSGNGFDVHWARVPSDYINELPNDIPEIEYLIRFQNHGQKYIKVDQEKFRPNHVYVTDANVFEVFDFKLKTGNPKTALKEPYSIVLTESIAKKYFGKEDPMGKPLFIIGEYTDEEVEHKVTGIMKDLPSNTHLPVNILISFREPQERTWWAYIYILLAEGAKISDVEAKVPDFMAKHTNQDQSVPGEVTLEFQPLKDIHLHSNLAREIVPNGSMLYVKVFFIVGMFILFIGMINYLNLSSALAIGRSKEVGMRLILGAKKGQLVRFTLLESIFYNIIAAACSLLFVKALMPTFHGLTGAEMLLNPWILVGGLICLAILCGLLAGIYPAFVLASFSSLKMIRQGKSFNLSGKRNAFQLKRILVGVQFCASMILIGSAWIARNQVVYLHEKNLGMQTEQVLAIPNIPNPVTDKYAAFRDRVRTIPGVKSIAACMEVPSREIRDSGPTLVQGRNHDTEQAPMLDMQVISPGFLETMDIQLVAGEDRSDQYIFGPNPQFTAAYTPGQYLNEQKRDYLINETAMRDLGWENPEDAIGQQISWSIGGFQLAVGPITGVVKDFHQETLKNKIDPTLMVVEQIWLRTFLLKIETQNIEETISELQTSWNHMFPAYPMEYYFLDDLYNQLYKSERTQSKLLMGLSGLAIFIAFLGLFSLIAYSLQTRMKEIAIRRVVGANLNDLIQLISKEYLFILLFGGAIAIPLSYVWVKDWLQNFAYQIDISAITYIGTVALIVLLLLITVSFHTLRSVSLNPADILRDE